MDELIIRVLGGAASSFEEERLKRWRETAQENEARFQEMAQVWALTAPEPLVPSWGPPDVETILQDGDEQGHEASVLPIRGGRGSSSGTLGRKRIHWRAIGLLAASVAALAFGIRVVGFSGPEPLATYRATQGQSLTVTLGDGSYARLADGSVLQEWSVDGRREVSLEGRGFFAVARDENRPFIVRAGGGEVRVLGTRFQVVAEGRDVETVVVEGLVQLTGDGGSVEVPAGSLARIRDGQSPSVGEVEDVYGLLDWPDGILVFQGTPLSLAAREVSRHYGRTLQVTGSDLENRRVTAWFQGEPFEAVAESLCLVTEALCRSVDTGVSMGLEGESGGM